MENSPQLTSAPQLTATQPRSSLDADDFMLFLCRLHTLTLSSSSRSLQPCIWHVGLWRLSCYLRAGMWDPCLLVPPWCLPGDLRILSIAVIQLYANMSCPQVSKHATASRFFFHGTKCVCIILYIATSMEIVPRVLYQYSIIPLIPIVIRTYTQSIPKPQPQLHHRHTRTEAELAWPKGSSKHHLALQSIPTVSTKQHPFCVIGWRAFQRMARLAVHQQQACENSEGMESVGVERNLRVPQNIQNHCFARWNWLGDLGDLGVPKASSGKMMKNAWVICW